MPWRLVGFILLFSIFLVFILSNLENKCDISFIKWTIPQVYVFLTVFASFIFGMLCSIPIIISFKLKYGRGQSLKPKKEKKGKKDASVDEELNAVNTYEVH